MKYELNIIDHFDDVGLIKTTVAINEGNLEQGFYAFQNAFLEALKKNEIFGESDLVLVHIELQKGEDSIPVILYDRENSMYLVGTLVKE